ncbi:MAG TPA: class I SAM-dependent methyltransferase [Patescibacteria group bacterium]|nr:class I SAM-dependent methyltransferase [Patescibacteria group bacterium]
MKICFPPNLFNYDWYSIMQSYQQYVTKKATVLEIGASTPSHTKELARYCKRVIGVELMPERVPKNSDNITYKLEDWQYLTRVVHHNSIDVAFSTHVIEHIPNDLKAINELYEVLKPRGIALINTPNRERLVRVIIELFTGKRTFPYWEHQREYTEKDLIALLKKSKFEKYTIIPVVFGLHGVPIFIYFEKVPKIFRRYANFWEIHLFK